MNAMTNALKEAGMKTPTVKYRIWNWLKDHPEKTADDITKALGMNYAPAGELRDMELRGMIKAYSDVSRNTGPHGLTYKIKRYSVTDAKEYEVPDKPRKKKAPVVNPHAVNPHARYTDIVSTGGMDPRNTPAPRPKAKVELTEAEKFAAFLEFKQLMKDMK